jgi:RHS repeat-associated protein
MSLNVDPATNRVTSTGFQYDANGNDISRTTPNDPLKTFDVANRLATVNGFSYGYTADNRRVLKRNDSSGEEIYTFWSITGQRLGTYKLNVAGDAWTTLSTNVYFHGRLIQSGAPGNMQAVLTDRLGSNVTGGKRYFPYGEERGAGTANNDEKFATYYRDAESGLDYADQRYEAIGYGRFSSPDRVMTEAQPAQPNSWNGYSYTSGDPVNSNDPTGRFFCNTYGAWDWGGQPWWCDPSGPTFFCPAGLLPSPGGGCGLPPIVLVFPEVFIDPPPPDPANCSVSVAYSGTPRNGQNLVGITAYGPNSNQLGAYNRGSGGAPNTLGWFFAVQVQGNLSGDTNPGNWTPTQSAVISGTVQLQQLGAPVPEATPYRSVIPNDNPESFAIFRGAGMLDWLDIPGFVKYQRNGAVIVGANLTFTFTSTLTHTNGATCSTTWSLELNIRDGRGGMTRGRGR